MSTDGLLKLFYSTNLSTRQFDMGNAGSISYLLRQMKDEVPTEIDGKPYTGEKTRVELVAEKVWDGAMAGDARFTKELLDRMGGRSPHCRG